MNLQNDKNLMDLVGHAGRHSEGYHKYVLNSLKNATKGLKGEEYKQALTEALDKLRTELSKNPNLVKMK